MLQTFFEIAICVFAVYGGYCILHGIRRYLFKLIEKRYRDR